MKQNRYDDKDFFDKYSQMDRSKNGLSSAGEWETLKSMLPDFSGKRVLDLGCGYGWHCIYSIEHGALSAVGIDISEKMLAVAKEKTAYRNVEYLRLPIEDMDFPEETFDIVISSLALHYLASFQSVAEKLHSVLVPGGVFVFTVEHPVFTAYGSQDWFYDQAGKTLHFPVDNYFYEGERKAVFLEEEVIKYHRTLTTYLNGLLKAGFEITGVKEPMPTKELLDTVPGMKDELRRPMMLIVSACKK